MNVYIEREGENILSFSLLIARVAQLTEWEKERELTNDINEYTARNNFSLSNICEGEWERKKAICFPILDIFNQRDDHVEKNSSGDIPVCL